ncbi:MAG: PIN domain-containing protein [Nitrososphaerales archaeon]
MKFFLDTYAMREYLKGSASYKQYFVGNDLATSLLNLIELYYILLKDENEDVADNAYLAFKQYEVEISDSDIKKGMKFRLTCKAKRENISYGDAIGYTISRRLGADFLTGDDAFKEKPGVKFVK